MALAANALVDLLTAKSFLTITGASDDARIEKTIDRASDFCERWCGRLLKEIVHAAERHPGPDAPRFFVPHAPIKTSATIAVTLNGEVQTVWRTEADGDPENKDVLVGRSHPDAQLFVPDILYRAGGWRPSSAGNPFNVLLSWTGGFATIPDDLQEACLLIAQKAWRDEQRQLTEVVAINTPGGGVTLMDTAIPSRAQELLTPFRRRRMA